MKNIRFIREPGYTYDLFFLFILYFNKEYCLKNFINHNNSAEEIKYYERLLSDFGTVPENLVLFFHLGNNPRTWISTYYFHAYKEKFLEGTYSLETVQEALLDYDQVIENVLRYYFEEASDETIQKCKSSLVEANKLICESKYEARIKSALYAFLIDPVPVIRRLSHELMAKEFALINQYEQKFQELSAFQENIDLNFLSSGFKTCGYDSINIDYFDNILISFCYNNKNLIRIFTFKSKNSIFLVLGVDYKASLQYLKDVKVSPKLHEFGLALSEENRVAILQLIHEKKEVMIKEVEQDLQMAGTNAYYHLSILSKAGMLKTRNKGKIILYSLNSEYFEKIGTMIISFSPTKGGIPHEKLENPDDNDHL